MPLPGVSGVLIVVQTHFTTSRHCSIDYCLDLLFFPLRPRSDPREDYLQTTCVHPNVAEIRYTICLQV